jgi:hypothetical protein
VVLIKEVFAIMRSMERILEYIVSIIKSISLFFILMIGQKSYSLDHDPEVDIHRVPSEYPIIQAAINAAKDGDIVLVAPGLYRGFGNRNLSYEGKAITVMSERGPKLTIIDCLKQARAFSFHNRETRASVLDGFKITQGFPYGNGGGIYCAGASPTIMNCIIAENKSRDYMSSRGGGIYCESSNAVIRNCIITGNIADGYGEFPSGNGGGIFCGSSDIIISNCTFTLNVAREPYLYDSFGGGICLDWSDAKISNCIFNRNCASIGGAICSRRNSNSTVTNCTFVRNWAYNHGTEINCDTSASITITNCIVWGRSSNKITGTGTISVTYSNIRGGWEGEGNINAKPRLIWRPLYGFEYLLQRDSPCIDTGDPTINDRLYDWYHRWPEWYPNGARSDMGAYGGPGNWKWVR